jgi:hypothetical protein
MQRSGPTSPMHVPTRHAARSARTVVALLLVSLACAVLTACGGSADPSPTRSPSPQAVEAYKKQRVELLELVSCARRHGVPLPAPTANNKISTRGVNLKSHRRKAAINACYQKVVKKASSEEQEQAERERPPPRLGEEPPAGQAQTAESGGTAFVQERKRLMEVVSCARRHGVHLRQPDAHNHINTRGLHLQKGHNKTVMNICFHNVVSKAEEQVGK